MSVEKLYLWLEEKKQQMREANKPTRKLLAHQCWGAIDLALALGVISESLAEVENGLVNDFM